QLFQRAAEVGSADLLGAVRREDERRGGRARAAERDERAVEVEEELERLAASPLEVLDREDERRALRPAEEEVGDRLDEAEALDAVAVLLVGALGRLGAREEAAHGPVGLVALALRPALAHA